MWQVKNATNHMDTQINEILFPYDTWPEYILKKIVSKNVAYQDRLALIRVLITIYKCCFLGIF
jgi:hypothetical protein